MKFQIIFIVNKAALHVAVENENYEIVNLLLQYDKIDVNVKSIQKKLMFFNIIQKNVFFFNTISTSNLIEF